jgi:hypothetical protein
MKNCNKLLALLFFLSWPVYSVNGESSDSSRVVIIHPKTSLPLDLKENDPVDIAIRSLNLARRVYYALNNCESLILPGMDEEVMKMLMKIQEYDNTEFLKRAEGIMKRTFNYCLFTSIEKRSLGNIILRAEVLDKNGTLVASKEQTLTPQELLVKNFIVNSAITKLANGICSKLVPPKNPVGLLSLAEYTQVSEKQKFSFGLGFGRNSDYEFEIADISSDLRKVLPHPEDVNNRKNDLLPESNTKNYIIGNNRVTVKAGGNLYLDLINVSFWGIANISLRTTMMVEPDHIWEVNTYRKWYVTNDITNPDNPDSGTAYIYYSLHPEGKGFMTRNSFSLPVCITYPVLYGGNNRELILKLMGGSNVLMPNKLEIVAEKGWYRYSKFEIMQNGSSVISELKEIDWFGGIALEGNFFKTIKLDLQVARVHAKFKSDENALFSLQNPDCYYSTLRMGFRYLF